MILVWLSFVAQLVVYSENIWCLQYHGCHSVYRENSEWGSCWRRLCMARRRGAAASAGDGKPVLGTVKATRYTFLPHQAAAAARRRHAPLGRQESSAHLLGSRRRTARRRCARRRACLRAHRRCRPAVRTERVCVGWLGGKGRLARARAQQCPASLLVAL